MAQHLSSVRLAESSLKNNRFRATFERANWWLRDVVSAANFANVNNNGNCNYNNASNSNGVRPDFDDKNKSSKEANIRPKGKVVLAERLNNSTRRWSRAVSICLMRRVTMRR